MSNLQCLRRNVLVEMSFKCLTDGLGPVGRYRLEPVGRRREELPQRASHLLAGQGSREGQQSKIKSLNKTKFTVGAA